MRWSRARHPRMTRNRSGHSRRLRVGAGMRSPSVWHFVKRFAPCRSGTLYGQNRHRTVPFHLHPPATHLAMQPASRLRHPLPGLQRSQRRPVRHRPPPSGVGDRNAERPRPARRNRRPAKAPPHHRLLAVAVRGGIRTQTPITDGGGKWPRQDWGWRGGDGPSSVLCRPVWASNFDTFSTHGMRLPRGSWCVHLGPDRLQDSVRSVRCREALSLSRIPLMEYSLGVIFCGVGYRVHRRVR